MDILLPMLYTVTAVATSTTACTALVNFVTNIYVNIRQRDNGDYSLGLYLEHSGLPASNVVVHVRVNGAALPPFRWPSMKAGQSI